jgi:hypothetical protein
MAATLEQPSQLGTRTARNLSLNAVQLALDASEDDATSSWTQGLPYSEVLSRARATVPAGRHLVTLREYMNLWSESVARSSEIACNQADHWIRFYDSLDARDPLCFFRHPFRSTVLVDTYLADFVRSTSGQIEATVFVAGKESSRVPLPSTGKIYQIGEHGLPVSTGGRKTAQSEPFEHRWWALSSDRLQTGSPPLALFANGGTIGCFCELVKAHYFLNEWGGYYSILTHPDTSTL